MGKEALVGVWKLVLFEYRRSNGELVYPLGQDPTGSLIYHENGRYSVQVSRRDRPVFTSSYFKDLAPEQLKIALDGYFAYYGTYEVNEAQKTITHYVEASLFPNWIGTEQVRHFEFSGNRLTLRMPPRKGGKEQRTGLLVWERFP